MGLFSRKKAKPEEPVKAPEPKVVTHKVAGTSYRQDAIRSLGKKNPDYALSKRRMFKRWPYGVTVYEYNFQPKKAKLVPEPDNPYDPNAIKVMIDGVHVGYIKAGSCAHILRLISEKRIAKIEPHIIGGKYKELYSEDIDAQRLADFELEEDETTIGVRLDITELPAAEKKK